jgi:hypothetical protein
VSADFFCVKAKFKKPAVRREQFADGSELVTYPDGSMSILETELSRESVLLEAGLVNYNEPPPPQADGKPTTKLEQHPGKTGILIIKKLSPDKVGRPKRLRNAGRGCMSVL